MSETTFPQIKAAIDQTADAFIAFKANQEQRLDGLQDRLEEIEAKGANPGRTSPLPGGSAFRTLKTKSGIVLPYLTSEQKAADYYGQRADKGDDSDFDLGEFCRSAMLGAPAGKAASGVATVPTGVSSQIIDNVRALTAVTRAGAGTIMLDGPTNMARISGDPTVYQHTEGAVDIVESDITIAAVSLNPKLLAVLIPLTVEVVQDSPNLNALLQTSLAAAFALKLDTLSIAKILADAAIPKSLVAHSPATWAGTMLAVTAALAANQDLPTAHVSTPANFMARASQLASTAGTWLGRPPSLAAMQELFTSSMTADIAVFGRFAEGFAIATRSELTVEVVRHAKPTSASHLLVAHMRADGIVLQPGRLFIQKLVP